MSKTHNFWDVVKERRTYYQLNKEAPVSDERIEQLVKEAVLNVPSAFNSQTARLVVLLREEHDLFWDLVKDALKPIVPAAQFETTEKKLNGFKAAYGTVSVTHTLCHLPLPFHHLRHPARPKRLTTSQILFFEDTATVQTLQKNFALYADKFPQWSEHTSAMHQFVLWAGLENEGFGANLQHYNPVVDAAAQAQWDVPAAWSLKAQLVFGGRAGEPGPKTFQPLEERLFVHGREGPFKN